MVVKRIMRERGSDLVFMAHLLEGVIFMVSR